MDSYKNHVEFWKILYFYTYVLFQVQSIFKSE